MKDIEVVIINFNTSKYTVQCVNSVLEKTDPSLTFRIVVVDNASNTNDLNFLREKLPSAENVILIECRVNTGFGGGNMEGFKHTNAKYTVFLNNDAFLQNDCMRILYDLMGSRRDAGGVTAQNYDEYASVVIIFENYKGLIKFILVRNFPENRQPVKAPEVITQHLQAVELN